MLSRRAFSSLLLATAVAPSVARAQNFPPSQVRMTVPFPPGGATDVLGRVVAQQLQMLWGNTVIIENKPGASGLVGARQVMAQPGDGANLLLASTGTILAVASQSKERPYDVRRDLMPISMMAAPPYILVVNPKLPVTTTAELIAYGKANKLSYGSSGIGAGTHLSGALFARMAGIDLLHVPYRGSGPAVTDLLGGRIDLMFAPAPVVVGHIPAGTLRAIGTTGTERSPLFPNMPTVAETGLPGFQSIAWFGVFAPAAMPADLASRISADVGRALTRDDVKRKLADEGAEPAPNSPEVFTAFINADVKVWNELADSVGIAFGK
jgi:tripartite-type tricarboxylate transporter receptor subunit TctC